MAGTSPAMTLVCTKSTASPRQASLPPQESQQREQRKPEDGEVIAFDLLEQVAPQAFELIAADAGGDRRAGRVQIGVEEALGQRPHGQLRAVHMAEYHPAVARQRDRRMELVGAARQRMQLLARRIAI